jgi:hypothetical protein
VYLQRFIEIFKLEQFFSIQQSCKSESKKKSEFKTEKFSLEKKKKKIFSNNFFSNLNIFTISIQSRIKSEEKLKARKKSIQLRKINKKNLMCELETREEEKVKR